MDYIYEIRQKVGVDSFGRFPVESTYKDIIKAQRDIFASLPENPPAQKFKEMLKYINRAGFLVDCAEIGYIAAHDNFSHTFLGLYLPVTSAPSIKEVAEEDDRINVYIVDFPSEIEMRRKEIEQRVEIDKSAREIKVVSYDVGANYFNYLLKKYPTNNLVNLINVRDEIAAKYIYVGIRYYKPGPSTDWVFSIVRQMIDPIFGE